MSELKPCPFCGGEPVYLADDSYDSEHAGCMNCDVFFVSDKNTGYSKEQWNRRAPDPEKAELERAIAVACMTVRNEALEEAAQEVESWDPDYRTPRVLADDIRGLKAALRHEEER